MDHFPIFLALAGRRVVVSGGGAAALAKLRLLLKTRAHLTVIAAAPAPKIEAWAAGGLLRLIRRPQEPGDALCAALFYAANDDPAEDRRTTRLAQADGALTNWVDNLAESQFITPAIVDRDPVTIAIGTEGAAPVLARRIKADLEARLPAGLGLLAQAAKGFRKAAAVLPEGRARRAFWAAFFDRAGPEALAAGGEAALKPALDRLLARHRAQAQTRAPGRVDLVGAGPGDPDLLTLKARRLLDRADVVIHDRLVPPAILELARREAVIIEAGKTGFGPSMPQEEICALMLTHARQGAHVLRLKSGDPGVFGRLDEEIAALEAAGIAWSIVPGITAASAAAADIGQSLTKRDRNSALRLLTGHDVKGFAEQDWRGLARPGAVAAIYMGKRGARFLQGRLLMHGAAPETPVTAVAKASQPGAHVLATELSRLPADLDAASLDGPVILLYGLAPRAARAALASPADGAGAPGAGAAALPFAKEELA
jgi:uroporphyrin-III C-methyltransferase/precorrin-2 dehydrogenase/sirohydrochlorin ferrochelatase